MKKDLQGQDIPPTVEESYDFFENADNSVYEEMDGVYDDKELITYDIKEPEPKEEEYEPVGDFKIPLIYGEEIYQRKKALIDEYHHLNDFLKGIPDAEKNLIMQDDNKAQEYNNKINAILAQQGVNELVDVRMMLAKQGAIVKQVNSPYIIKDKDGREVTVNPLSMYDEQSMDNMDSIINEKGLELDVLKESLLVSQHNKQYNPAKTIHEITNSTKDWLLYNDGKSITEDSYRNGYAKYLPDEHYGLLLDIADKYLNTENKIITNELLQDASAHVSAQALAGKSKLLEIEYNKKKEKRDRLKSYISEFRKENPKWDIGLFGDFIKNKKNDVEILDFLNKIVKESNYTKDFPGLAEYTLDRSAKIFNSMAFNLFSSKNPYLTKDAYDKLTIGGANNLSADYAKSILENNELQTGLAKYSQDLANSIYDDERRIFVDTMHNLENGFKKKARVLQDLLRNAYDTDVNRDKIQERIDTYLKASNTISELVTPAEGSDEENESNYYNILRLNAFYSGLETLSEGVLWLGAIAEKGIKYSPLGFAFNAISEGVGGETLDDYYNKVQNSIAQQYGDLRQGLLQENPVFWNPEEHQHWHANMDETNALMIGQQEGMFVESILEMAATSVAFNLIAPGVGEEAAIELQTAKWAKAIKNMKNIAGEAVDIRKASLFAKTASTVEEADALSRAQKIINGIKKTKRTIKLSKLTTPDLLLGKGMKNVYLNLTKGFTEKLIAKHPVIGTILNESIGTFIEAFPSYYKGKYITGMQNGTETMQSYDKSVFSSITTDDGNTMYDTINQIYSSAYKARAAELMGEILDKDKNHVFTDEEKRNIRNLAYKEAEKAKQEYIQGYLIKNKAFAVAYNKNRNNIVEGEIRNNLLYGGIDYFTDYIGNKLLTGGGKIFKFEKGLPLIFAPKNVIGRTVNSVTNGVLKLTTGMIERAPASVLQAYGEKLEESYTEKTAQQANLIDREMDLANDYDGAFSPEIFAKIQKDDNQGGLDFVVDQFIANYYNPGSQREGDGAFYGTLVQQLLTGGLWSAGGGIHAGIKTRAITRDINNLQRAMEGKALATLTGQQKAALMEIKASTERTLIITSLKQKIAELQKKGGNEAKIAELKDDINVLTSIGKLYSLNHIEEKYGAGIIDYLTGLMTDGGSSYLNKIKAEEEKIQEDLNHLYRVSHIKDNSKKTDNKAILNKRDKLKELAAERNVLQNLKGLNKDYLETYTTALIEAENYEAKSSNNEEENNYITKKLRSKYRNNAIRKHELNKKIEKTNNEILEKTQEINELTEKKQETTKQKKELKKLERKKEVSSNQSKALEIEMQDILAGKLEKREQIKIAMIKHFNQNFNPKDILSAAKKITEKNDKSSLNDAIKEIFNDREYGLFKKILRKTLGKVNSDQFSISKLKEAGFTKGDLNEVLSEIAEGTTAMAMAMYSQTLAAVVKQNKSTLSVINSIKAIINTAIKGETYNVTDLDVFSIEKIDDSYSYLTVVKGEQQEKLIIPNELANDIARYKDIIKENSNTKGAVNSKGKSALRALFSSLLFYTETQAQLLSNEGEYTDNYNNITVENIEGIIRGEIADKLGISEINKTDDVSELNSYFLFNRNETILNEINKSLTESEDDYDFISKLIDLLEDEKFKTAIAKTIGLNLADDIDLNTIITHVMKNVDKYGTVTNGDINAKNIYNSSLIRNVLNIFLSSMADVDNELKTKINNEIAILEEDEFYDAESIANEDEQSELETITDLVLSDNEHISPIIESIKKYDNLSKELIDRYGDNITAEQSNDNRISLEDALSLAEKKISEIKSADNDIPKVLYYNRLKYIIANAIARGIKDTTTDNSSVKRQQLISDVKTGKLKFDKKEIISLIETALLSTDNEKTEIESLTPLAEKMEKMRIISGNKSEIIKSDMNLLSLFSFYNKGNNKQVKGIHGEDRVIQPGELALHHNEIEILNKIDALSQKGENADVKVEKINDDTIRVTIEGIILGEFTNNKMLETYLGNSISKEGKIYASKQRAILFNGAKRPLKDSSSDNRIIVRLGGDTKTNSSNPTLILSFVQHNTKDGDNTKHLLATGDYVIDNMDEIKSLHNVGSVTMGEFFQLIPIRTETSINRTVTHYKAVPLVKNTITDNDIAVVSFLNDVLLLNDISDVNLKSELQSNISNDLIKNIQTIIRGLPEDDNIKLALSNVIDSINGSTSLSSKTISTLKSMLTMYRYIRTINDDRFIAIPGKMKEETLTLTIDNRADDSKPLYLYGDFNSIPSLFASNKKIEDLIGGENKKQIAESIRATFAAKLKNAIKTSFSEDNNSGFKGFISVEDLFTVLEKSLSENKIVDIAMQKEIKSMLMKSIQSILLNKASKITALHDDNTDKNIVNATIVNNSTDKNPFFVLQEKKDFIEERANTMVEDTVAPIPTFMTIGDDSNDIAIGPILFETKGVVLRAINDGDFTVKSDDTSKLVASINNMLSSLGYDNAAYMANNTHARSVNASFGLTLTQYNALKGTIIRALNDNRENIFLSDGTIDKSEISKVIIESINNFNTKIAGTIQELQSIKDALDDSLNLNNTVLDNLPASFKESYLGLTAAIDDMARATISNTDIMAEHILDDIAQFIPVEIDLENIDEDGNIIDTRDATDTMADWESIDPISYATFELRLAIASLVDTSNNGFLGMRSNVDFTTTYNKLLELLSGSGNSFNEQIELLEEWGNYDNAIANMASNIRNVTKDKKYLQNDFVKAFSLQQVNFLSIKLDNKKNDDNTVSPYAAIIENHYNRSDNMARSRMQKSLDTFVKAFNNNANESEQQTAQNALSRMNKFLSSHSFNKKTGKATLNSNDKITFLSILRSVGVDISLATLNYLIDTEGLQNLFNNTDASNLGLFNSLYVVLITNASTNNKVRVNDEKTLKKITEVDAILSAGNITGVENIGGKKTFPFIPGTFTTQRLKELLTAEDAVFDNYVIEIEASGYGLSSKFIEYIKELRKNKDVELKLKSIIHNISQDPVEIFGNKIGKDIQKLGIDGTALMYLVSSFNTQAIAGSNKRLQKLPIITPSDKKTLLLLEMPHNDIFEFTSKDGRNTNLFIKKAGKELLQAEINRMLTYLKKNYNSDKIDNNVFVFYGIPIDTSNNKADLIGLLKDMLAAGNPNIDKNKTIDVSNVNIEDVSTRLFSDTNIKRLEEILFPSNTTIVSFFNDLIATEKAKIMQLFPTSKKEGNTRVLSALKQQALAEVKRRKHDEVTMDVAFDNLLTEFIVNGMLNNLEYTKVFSTDLMNYKKGDSAEYGAMLMATSAQLNKRSVIQSSSGLNINKDNVSEVHIVPITDEKGIEPNELKELEEIFGGNNVPEAYKDGVEATDGNAYHTWKAHLTMIAGSVIQGRIITNEDIDRLTELFENNIPYKEYNENDKSLVTLVMQVTKPVITGVAIINGELKPILVKPSSLPLLPPITQTVASLDGLRRKMEQHENENDKTMVIAARESAIKLELGLPAYNTRDLNDKTSKTGFSNKVIISSDSYRIQQELPYKSAKGERHHIPLPTQMFKILFSNGMASINNELAKAQESFNSSVIAIMNLLQDALLDELGLTSLDDIKEMSKSRTQMENVLEKLKNSLNSYDISATLEIKKETRDGEDYYVINVPTWSTNLSHKMTDAFGASVKNAILKIDMPGYSYADEPMAMLRGGTTNLNASEAFANIAFTGDINEIAEVSGDDISFNFDKDGVFLPAKFQYYNSTTGKMELFDLYAKNKNGNYKYLKEVSINDQHKFLQINKEALNIAEDLLKTVNIRIPTSAHYSGSGSKIIGFLPPSVGDVVLVSASMTVQKGLDFDIDKEYVYHYDHVITYGKTVTINKIDKAIMDTLGLKLTSEELIAYIESLEDINMLNNILSIVRPESVSDELKSIKAIKTELLLTLHKNNIIKAHMDVFHNSDNKVKLKIANPLDFSQATHDAEYFNDEKKHFSILSPVTQMFLHDSLGFGKLAIAIYSKNMTFKGILEALNNNDKELLDNALNSLKIKFKGQTNKHLLTLTGVQALNIDNSGTREISEMLGERQNISTDDAKLNALSRLGINQNSAPVDIILSMFGLDTFISEDGEKVSFTNTILSHPVTRRLLSTIDNTKLLKKGNKSIHAAIADVLSKYEIPISNFNSSTLDKIYDENLALNSDYEVDAKKILKQIKLDIEKVSKRDVIFILKLIQNAKELSEVFNAYGSLMSINSKNTWSNKEYLKMIKSLRDIHNNVVISKTKNDEDKTAAEKFNEALYTIFINRNIGEIKKIDSLLDAEIIVGNINSENPYIQQFRVAMQTTSKLLSVDNTNSLMRKIVDSNEDVLNGTNFDKAVNNIKLFISRKYSSDILTKLFGKEEAGKSIDRVENGLFLRQLSSLKASDTKNKFLNAILITDNKMQLDRTTASLEEMIDGLLTLPLNLFGLSYEGNLNHNKNKAEAQGKLDDFIRDIIAYSIINASNSPRDITALVSPDFINTYYSSLKGDNNIDSYYEILREYTNIMVNNESDSTFRNIINLNSSISGTKNVALTEHSIRIGDNKKDIYTVRDENGVLLNKDKINIDGSVYYKIENGLYVKGQGTLGNKINENENIIKKISISEDELVFIKVAQRLKLSEDNKENKMDVIAEVMNMGTIEQKAIFNLLKDIITADIVYGNTNKYKVSTNTITLNFNGNSTHDIINNILEELEHSLVGNMFNETVERETKDSVKYIKQKQPQYKLKAGINNKTLSDYVELYNTAVRLFSNTKIDDSIKEQLNVNSFEELLIRYINDRNSVYDVVKGNKELLNLLHDLSSITEFTNGLKQNKTLIKRLNDEKIENGESLLSSIISKIKELLYNYYYYILAQHGIVVKHNSVLHKAIKLSTQLLVEESASVAQKKKELLRTKESIGYTVSSKQNAVVKEINSSRKKAEVEYKGVTAILNGEMAINRSAVKSGEVIHEIILSELQGKTAIYKKEYNNVIDKPNFDRITKIARSIKSMIESRGESVVNIEIPISSTMDNFSAEELAFSGKLDILTKNHDGTFSVYELKTTTVNESTMDIRERIAGDNDNYIKQVQIYSSMLMSEFKAPISKASIIMIPLKKKNELIKLEEYPAVGDNHYYELRTPIYDKNGLFVVNKDSDAKKSIFSGRIKNMYSDDDSILTILKENLNSETIHDTDELAIGSVVVSNENNYIYVGTMPSTKKDGFDYFAKHFINANTGEVTVLSDSEITKDGKLNISERHFVSREIYTTNNGKGLITNLYVYDGDQLKIFSIEKGEKEFISKDLIKEYSTLADGTPTGFETYIKNIAMHSLLGKYFNSTNKTSLEVKNGSTKDIKILIPGKQKANISNADEFTLKAVSDIQFSDNELEAYSKLDIDNAKNIIDKYDSNLRNNSIILHTLLILSKIEDDNIHINLFLDDEKSNEKISNTLLKILFNEELLLKYSNNINVYGYNRGSNKWSTYSNIGFVDTTFDTNSGMPVMEINKVNIIATNSANGIRLLSESTKSEYYSQLDYISDNKSITHTEELSDLNNFFDNDISYNKIILTKAQEIQLKNADEMNKFTFIKGRDGLYYPYNNVEKNEKILKVSFDGTKFSFKNDESKNQIYLVNILNEYFDDEISNVGTVVNYILENGNIKPSLDNTVLNEDIIKVQKLLKAVVNAGGYAIFSTLDNTIGYKSMNEAIINTMTKDEMRLLLPRPFGNNIDEFITENMYNKFKIINPVLGSINRESDIFEGLDFRNIERNKDSIISAIINRLNTEINQSGKTLKDVVAERGGVTYLNNVIFDMTNQKSLLSENAYKKLITEAYIESIAQVSLTTNKILNNHYKRLISDANKDVSIFAKIKSLITFANDRNLMTKLTSILSKNGLKIYINDGKYIIAKEGLTADEINGLKETEIEDMFTKICS